MSLVEKALRKLQESGSGPPKDLPGLRPPPEPHKATKDTGVRYVPSLPPARTIVLDMEGLRAAGMLPPTNQERAMAQQYRQIKRPLIAAALGHGVPKLPKGHIIMVASAMPGEGKTFTCLNLALSLAREKDIRVLLVDADLPKPHISRQLGLADEPGLLDALRDPKLEIERIIVGTDVPRLSVLPAGTRSEDATELIASARMDEILTKLSESDSNQLIVLDSPPLLLTAESPALAQIAGQVVVVVHAGRTTQRVLNDALSHIREGPAIALVLNQVSVPTGDGYHYYYGFAEGREAGGE